MELVDENGSYLLDAAVGCRPEEFERLELEGKFCRDHGTRAVTWAQRVELLGEMIEERLAQDESSGFELLRDDRFIRREQLRSARDRREASVRPETMINECVDAPFERTDADILERDLRQDPQHRVAHGCVHEEITMLEVTVDRAIGHTGALGNGIDRRADVAVFTARDHCVEHQLAIPDPPQGAAVRGYCVENCCHNLQFGTVF